MTLGDRLHRQAGGQAVRQPQPLVTGCGVSWLPPTDLEHGEEEGDEEELRVIAGP